MPMIPASQFEPGDELGPSFDIFIEGKDASSSSPAFEAIRPLIAGVTYEEDEEMTALFELQVINQPDIRMGEGSKVDWHAVLDCKAFQEGNGIDLFMGYAGAKTYMGRVEIVKWLPKFGAQGPTEFLIKGFDGRHRMMQGNQVKAKAPKEDKASGGAKGKQASLAGKAPKASKGSANKQRHVYRSMTDDQVVKKVAAKYGFAVDCDTPEKGLAAKSGGKKKGVVIEKGVVQKEEPAKSKRRTAATPTRVQVADQTDWLFLQRLATINRFDLWVDYDLEAKRWVVHFKKRQDIGDPLMTFTYNGEDGSLLEAEPDFSVKEQSTSVEVLYFDRKTRTIELTSLEDQTKEEDVSFGTAMPGSFTAKKTTGVGARVRFTAFGQSLEAISNKPFRSRKDAEAFIADWLKEKERDLVVLKGKVVGMESLRPRQVHEFLGMNTRLDGVYRLTQVKHVMQPGSPYVVEFIAHKVLSEDISRRKATTKAKVKAKGIVVEGGKVSSK